MARFKHLLIALAFLVAILGFNGEVWADLLGIDLTHLSSIAASEILEVAKLGDLVAKTAALAKDVNEQATLLKTVYHGIDDIVHARWEDLRRDVVLGITRAAPEISDLYSNLQEITDLNHTNAQAKETLRGMLWTFAYGPAVDYLHQQHDDLDAVAGAAELHMRQQGKLSGNRSLFAHFEDECRKGSGQCMGIANHATVVQGQVLADLQEIALEGVEMQRRLLIVEDQKVTARYYEHQRFVGDFAEHALAVLGPSLQNSQSGCRPGRCLYETFHNSPYESMARFRRNHEPRRDVHSAWGSKVATGFEMAKGLWGAPAGGGSG